MFELWCDQKKLLGNMSLSVAIGSFLHLAFTFDLKYPKEAETLAEIWERKFAKYGDDTGVACGIVNVCRFKLLLSGTRANVSVSTAKSNIKKYNTALGELA